MKVLKVLIDEIKKNKNKIKNQRDLNSLKLQFARSHGINFPTNIEIMNQVPKKDRDELKKILMLKPVRTISGVAPVAIMTKPHKCPHGSCLFCPGGPKSKFGDVPQSYTGKEPATRRAIRNGYDPYLQVMNRLEHYVLINQNPEKVELIIMGGTFLSLSYDYVDEFVMYAFKAMNDFSELFYKDNELDIEKFQDFFEINTNRDDPERMNRIHAKLLKYKKTSTLAKEKKRNEDSMIKCIGQVIETRPDVCNEKHIDKMLELGCTKVEVGIQSVYDEALRVTGRQHTAQQGIDATQRLKDAGFKVTYHLMPGMIGVDRKKDLEGLKQIFTDTRYRPDMLKIYPCMVMPGTVLYDMYKEKRYKPMTTKQAVALIAKFKDTIPEYVRVNRVQRDIPTTQVSKGVDKTNLRQYIMEYMKKHNLECRCIRCREIKDTVIKGEIEYNLLVYEASEGDEVFISAEYNDKIVGFCRLRFPYKPYRKEITKKSALIRELHVYGASTSLKEKGTTQHKGVGKKLLAMAEDLVKKNNRNKIVVISGVGVRGYYKKLGYKLEGPYMVKKI
ncbi:tRNA uridine(34) 5-carboxymethylaminomethyl modification radical SAM/GNAT enzyme Elp3 [Candidatus Woesearchaeota archaeon]|nr:tRNA uridine(34) 5-carboxymethylaminomethyl modification radical SAM/GNAT enzyme Elp3 [Candidatus Woesearchaeota archaeon]